MVRLVSPVVDCTLLDNPPYDHEDPDLSAALHECLHGIRDIKYTHAVSREGR